MLIIKHTEETSAKPEDVWAIWSDVENWKTWDHGIEYSSIEGPFADGTLGVLKPRGGPLLKTQLTHVEPFKGFVDESKLFLGKIIVSHEIVEFAGKTYVTHQVEMTGVLAFIYAFLIGRTMKKNLPTEMKAMLMHAEALSRAKETP